LKKSIVIFLLVLSTLFGVLYFVSSDYFFKRYIAKNIKEYNFDYIQAQGNLLTGFKIDRLKYKNNLLAKEAEVRFNPVKLLSKKISISKLTLIDVNKNVLDIVINDFTPKNKEKEDNTTSSDNLNFGFNFEIKNITLSILPFNIDGLKIDKNFLKVKIISFIDNKLFIGKTYYSAKSNIAEIKFDGNFKHKVLFIDNLNVKNLDVKKVLEFVKNIKTNSLDDNNKSLNLGYIPKKILIKNSNVDLKPLKFKDINISNLTLSAKDGEFNLEKMQFKKGKVNFKNSSSLAKIDLNFILKDKNLTLNNFNADIYDFKKILNLFENGNDKNSSNSKNLDLSFIDAKNINLKKLNLKIDSFTYKQNRFKKIKSEIKNCFFNLKSSKINCEDIFLGIESNLLSLNSKISLNKDIVVKNLDANSKNLDNLIDFILSFKSKEENNSTLNLPFEKLVVNSAKAKFNNLSFEPFIINNGEVSLNKAYISLKNFKIDAKVLEAKVKSNWGEANLKGDIKNSRYYAEGFYKPYQELFKQYSIPIIAKNLKPLKVKGEFGFNDLKLNAKLSGKDILSVVKNFDIEESFNIFKYDYKSGDIFWKIDANINSIYTSKAKLKNILEYKDKLIYSGSIKPIKKLDFTKNLDELFSNLKLNYKGDSQKIDISFSTNKLKGFIDSKSYKGGILKIVNTKNIDINKLVNLGENFKNAKINLLKISAPINFEKPLPLKGKIDLNSNLITLKGTWEYNKEFKLISNINLSKNSLLNSKLKCLNKKVIFPLKLNLAVNKGVKAVLKNKNISSNIDYLNKKIKAVLNYGNLKLNLNGEIENLTFDIKTNSLKNALKNIKRVCKINNLGKIDGDLKISGKIINFKKINFKINSSKTVLDNGEIKNISIIGEYDKNLLINRYALNYNGYKIYANKSSTIVFDKNILIKNFWVNDSLLISGLYNLKNSSGKFNFKSNNFNIKSSQADANLKIDAKANIKGQKVAISGAVNILNAIIKTNLKQRAVADNEDIIIIQKQKEKENTKFAKNIKLNLKIVSKNGIVYKQSDSYFKLFPNLTIVKNFNELSNFKGVIKIDKNGYYIISGKKLKVQKGLIRFKGKSTTPYLNIVMNYKGKDYTIKINISGTASNPILFFSSNPPLTKDQILAYLLFDDSSAAGTHSQESMLNMIGGTLAKSFLGSIGIKIDHISIKEDGFSIGKSLGKHIIIYYNQEGEKSSVKTRIDITKSIRTEIEVGQDSQSADIIFSKEY